MNYKHGKCRSRAYSIWSSMRSRCLNPNEPAFPNYGGRGITVSDAWAEFAVFFADMGEPPKGFTLERIDNDQGYAAGNCRWASRTEQGRNKRNNVLVTIDGDTRPLSAWAEHFGLKYSTVHQRISGYGWTHEQALTTPLVTKRKGVPRGQRIAEFGARHSVVFHDSERSAA